MKLPDIVQAFKAVCSRDTGALLWGNPEPWIHAELFAEFKKQSQFSGWVPFDVEVPYVTNYPVQIPKPSNRDWKLQGAVKWVDLCLHTMNGNQWCWFEFKVRHAGELERAQKAALEARDAFRKDIVALLGFDANATGDIWQEYDFFTTAYWFESILKPHINEVRVGKHHFISAFLQLGGEMDTEIWSQDAIRKQVYSWQAYRCKQRGAELNESKNLKITSCPIGYHWLILVEW